jgi:predicted transcriptional regulator
MENPADTKKEQSISKDFYEKCCKEFEFYINDDWEDDIVCIPLAKLIEKEGKLNLSEIIKKTGMARQTAHNHLSHLTKEGILFREKRVYGRGRPKILYCRTSKPIKSLTKKTNAFVVNLRFQSLRHACRFEKDEWCNERKNKCASSTCPLIIR